MIERDKPVELADFLRPRPDWIGETLTSHGAILFRGFGIDTPAATRRVAEAVYTEAVAYSGGTLPRSTVEAGVYTADELSPRIRLAPHHAMSYAAIWPTRLLFSCARPAIEGGRTPLASARGVIRRLRRSTLEEFEHRGVAYVRSYADGIGPPASDRQSWSQCYATEDRAEVHDFCERNETRVDWLPNGGLRTRRIAPATVRHPLTAEKIFFNHAHLLHVSAWALTEPDPVRAAAARALVAAMQEEEAYYNATYGDGAPLDVALLDEVRRAIAAETVTFDWQRGDLLLLDNMLALHGREEFTGERVIFSAHGDPCSHAAGRSVP